MGKILLFSFPNFKSSFIATIKILINFILRFLIYRQWEMFVANPEFRSSLLRPRKLINPYDKTDFEALFEEFFSLFEYVTFKEVFIWSFLFATSIRWWSKFLLKKNKFLDKILESCNLEQVNLLWTILQPVSHRDFHYYGKFEYPGFHFQKLSTPITRKIVKKNEILSY